MVPLRTRLWNRRKSPTAADATRRMDSGCAVTSGNPSSLVTDDELAVRMPAMVHGQSSGLLALLGFVATGIASGKFS